MKTRGAARVGHISQASAPVRGGLGESKKLLEKANLNLKAVAKITRRDELERKESTGSDKLDLDRVYQELQLKTISSPYEKTTEAGRDPQNAPFKPKLEKKAATFEETSSQFSHKDSKFALHTSKRNLVEKYLKISDMLEYIL